MPSRRQVLQFTGGVALAGLIPSITIAADKVPLTDPAAKALKYVEDAAAATDKVDKMGVAAADQTCANCRFYGADADGWGPCTLFQNRLVAGAGWCAGWIPTA